MIDTEKGLKNSKSKHKPKQKECRKIMPLKTREVDVQNQEIKQDN